MRTPFSSGMREEGEWVGIILRRPDGSYFALESIGEVHPVVMMEVDLQVQWSAPPAGAREYLLAPQQRGRAQTRLTVELEGWKVWTRWEPAAGEMTGEPGGDTFESRVSRGVRHGDIGNEHTT